MNLKKCECPFCKNIFSAIDDTEDEPDPLNRKPPKISLTVGEIGVLSQDNNLTECQAAVKSLIKDKSIQSYLKSFERKKIVMSMRPGYIE